jgi:hypothetical protein
MSKKAVPVPLSEAELTASRYFKVANPPMVRIYVGPKKDLWVLPENILCDRVDYFKSAFKGGFREGAKKILELPEDCPTAFGYIIDCILNDEEDGMRTINSKYDATIHMAWCKVWVLADKLGCSEIADEVTSIYSDSMRNWGDEDLIVPPAAVKFLYESTSDTCEMRRALVAQEVETFENLECIDDGALEVWCESATSHPRFYLDVMIEIKTRQLEKEDNS